MNEARLLHKAILAESSDPARLYGDVLGKALEFADREMPPYDYLPDEPDMIHRLQARQWLGEQPPNARDLLAFHLETFDG